MSTNTLTVNESIGFAGDKIVSWERNGPSVVVNTVDGKSRTFPCADEDDAKRLWLVVAATVKNEKAAP